ncbi:MAG TPA: rhodanese-like domain-containing protein [Gaiellaceae bacterium]|nr:rhodanese-like domain-containing protein [Gaiellaceae bacterium]
MSAIGHDELAARLDDDALTILDVRSAAEYEGLAGAPCDPRQGHIPGARHLDVQELLGLPPDAIRERVGLEPGAEIAAYCHSGSRSAVAVELLRTAGYAARNYTGSWHEWSRLHPE